MIKDFKVLSIFEEQVAVGFTGKLNVLSTFNHQFLGHVLFQNGQVVQAKLDDYTGMKALYHLLLQEAALQSHQYVIEPEVVEEREDFFQTPFPILKSQLIEWVKLHHETLKHRPPENVKILIDADFLEDTLPVTPSEFEVLASLTEWNRPYDIYQHCSLLDHEITTALVSLRKKSALRIVAAQDKP